MKIKSIKDILNLYKFKIKESGEKICLDDLMYNYDNQQITLKITLQIV